MEQHHPRTLAELLDIVESTLSREALADLQGLDQRILHTLHFSLGLYIQNHLVHQNDNKLALYKDCHRENPRIAAAFDPEANDVSQLAILRLWERLQETCPGVSQNHRNDPVQCLNPGRTCQPGYFERG